MDEVVSKGKKVKSVAGSLIKKSIATVTSDKKEDKEIKANNEDELALAVSEEELKKENENEKEEDIEYPDFVLILPPEDFEVPAYGAKEDDSKAEKFLRKKIGTTLDNAKAYKKRYDNLESTKKKAVTALGSPILSTAISIQSTWTDPKSKAAVLEKQVKGNYFYVIFYFIFLFYIFCLLLAYSILFLRICSFFFAFSSFLFSPFLFSFPLCFLFLLFLLFVCVFCLILHCLPIYSFFLYLFNSIHLFLFHFMYLFIYFILLILI